MSAGGAEGDPEGDGRRTLVNGWESRLWRLKDKHLREGSSVRQFGRPRPLRIHHRRKEEEEEEEEEEKEEEEEEVVILYTTFSGGLQPSSLSTLAYR